MAKKKLDVATEDRSVDPTIEPPASEPAVALRPLGWKKDTVDSFPEGVTCDVSAKHLLGAPVALAPEVKRLLGFIWKIYDQTITSSCVGWAIKQACMLRARIAAPTEEQAQQVEELSALGPYAFARMREKQRTSDALRDGGCFPRDAMYALSEDGIPSEKDWPFDESKVNDEPPWDVEQKASAHRITAFFRIDSEGRARVHDIMNAVSQNYPVIFGTFVDTTYMRYTGGVVRSMNTNDPQGGGHMQTIVGYTTDRDGSIIFIVLNQWGPNWGEKGLSYIHENVITSADSDDFYVIQITKGSSKTAGEPAKEAA